MSSETIEWLNSQVLIGQTDKRGKAWHYKAALQGAEPNHYTGPIPREDVIRRLFNWKPVNGDVTSSYLTTIDGEPVVGTITDPNRVTTIRPAGSFGPEDKGEILGVFKKFQIHDYEEWLVDNVGTILDSGLTIGSAGLLRGGAVGWVQCELDETVTTPEGVQFRPFMTAATSLDGSLSSTYQTGAQLVICDNTLAAALGRAAKDTRVKVRHSKNSLDKIGEVRDALGIVHNVAESFAAEVAELTRIEVDDAAWKRFLAAQFPINPDALKPGAPAGAKAAATRARLSRESLTQMWENDNRVADWTGTAFGVVQAVNTWQHHVVKPTEGTSRTERNATRTVEGAWAKLDQSTLDTLTKVLQSA